MLYVICYYIYTINCPCFASQSQSIIMSIISKGSAFQKIEPQAQKQHSTYMAYHITPIQVNYFPAFYHHLNAYEEQTSDESQGQQRQRGRRQRNQPQGSFFSEVFLPSLFARGYSLEDISIRNLYQLVEIKESVPLENQKNDQNDQ